jgi:hypothetical protein
VSDDFDKDVSLEDLLKVFQAPTYNVEVTDLPDGWRELKSGAVIDNLPPDSIVYKGKAQRLARKFNVALPDLYDKTK